MSILHLPSLAERIARRDKKSRKVEVVPLRNILSEFNPRGIQDNPDVTQKTYSISDNQRFAAWNRKKMVALVHSVLCDMPIHAVMMEKRIEWNPETRTGTELYYISDGQCRLTALYHFFNDGYPIEIDGDNKIYSQLDHSDQFAFCNYQLLVEVISNPTKEQSADIFECLNSAESSTDNDKFHNRKSTPVVAHAIGLQTQFPALFARFVGTVGKGKSRNLLGDMVGMIISIATNNTDNIITSYAYHCDQLHVFSETNITTVNRFLNTHYFPTLSTVLPAGTISKKYKRYGKLSGVLGLSIASIIIYGHIDDALKWYINKTYSDITFVPRKLADLPDGDRRNMRGSVIKRLEAIREQYRLDLLPQLSVPVQVVDDQTSETNSDEDDEDEDD